MAFETGSVPTLLSLIDAVRVFAVANGWTNNLYATQGAGKRLHLSKNGIFANFRACVNENPYVYQSTEDVEGISDPYGLWFNVSTGFDAGLDWYKQPNAPFVYTNPPTNTNKQYQHAGICGLNGALTYYLFSFDNCFYLVIEKPAGVFHWLGFGNARRVADWNGGLFFFAKHYPTSYVDNKAFPLFGSNYGGQGSPRGYLRVLDVDGRSGWARTYNSQESGNMRPEMLFDSINKSKTLWHVAPNLFSQKPILLPISLLMTRDNANAYGEMSYFAFLENIYFINISGLIPASNYPDGTGATFRLFPFHQKIDELPQNYPNYSTGTLGFAIKSN